MLNALHTSSNQSSQQSYLVGTNMTSKTHFDLGAFDLASPSARNTLPQDICLANSLTSFTSLIKSHLLKAHSI